MARIGSPPGNYPIRRDLAPPCCRGGVRDVAEELDGGSLGGQVAKVVGGITEAGGLEISNDEGTNKTVVANAAAVVRLDIPERRR